MGSRYGSIGRGLFAGADDALAFDIVWPAALFSARFFIFSDKGMILNDSFGAAPVISLSFDPMISDIADCASVAGMAEDGIKVVAVDCAAGVGVCAAVSFLNGSMIPSVFVLRSRSAANEGAIAAGDGDGFVEAVWADAGADDGTEVDGAIPLRISAVLGFDFGRTKSGFATVGVGFSISFNTCFGSACRTSSIDCSSPPDNIWAVFCF